MTSYSVEKRRDPGPASSQHSNSGGGVPPLLNTITQGGFTGEKKEFHCITAKGFSNFTHGIWDASVKARGS